MSGGIICEGEVGTRIFQLLAVRSAIRLEGLGMKNSRGSVRKMWAVHFGMKPSAKADAVLARIEAELTKLRNDPRGTGITTF